MRGVRVAPHQCQLSVFLFLFPARFNLLLRLALTPTRHHTGMSNRPCTRSQGTDRARGHRHRRKRHRRVGVADTRACKASRWRRRAGWQTRQQARQQTCSCRNACVSTSASSSGGMSNASPPAPKARAPTSASTSPFAPCAPCASATSGLLDALCCPLALGPSSPTSTPPAPRTAECVSALPPAARPGLELGVERGETCDSKSCCPPSLLSAPSRGPLPSPRPPPCRASWGTADLLAGARGKA